MERDGLVVVSGDRHLELTDNGHLKAMRVMRKHRLAERLLTDVIGLDWEFVHEEACRWEHVMSDRVEKRLLDLLDHPHHSPYGNPIPGLGELGEDRPDEQFLHGVLPLRSVAPLAVGDAAVTAVVERLGEPLQTDIELLTRLAGAGVRPGRTITVERGPGVLTVGEPGAETVLDLPDEVARHIFVAAPVPVDEIAAPAGVHAAGVHSS
jgi:DtxR family Mn-dependent transcriptional regulator